MAKAPRTNRLVPLALAAACALVAIPHAAMAQDDAPTVDQLVARHVEAKGGEAALAGLTGFKASGIYTAFSEPAEFTLWRARPDSVRFETTMLEASHLESFDGETAWSASEVSGPEWPLAMTPPEVTATQVIADFDGPLVDYRDKGHEVTLVGRTDLDGIDAWELTVKRAEGFEETWYLDAETYLEAARKAPTHDFGRPVDGITYFGDFRPVEGVQIPHLVESEYFLRHRILEISQIEANPAIPDGLFSKPPLEPMTALASLAGEWQVTVEARPPFPQAPWRESGTTTSTIQSQMDGTLLAESIEVTQQGRTIRSLRALSWDRFAERYRLAHFNDFTSHMNIFEGTLEDGRLVLSNAETNTRAVSSDQPQTERWIVYDIGAEGFKMEQEATTDEGETWVGVLRLTYGKEPAEG